jgi:hypothetical protein
MEKSHSTSGDSTSGDEKVPVELSRPEALVLFGLLTRWSEQDRSDIHLEHPAEQRVLWNIEAMLKTVLVEPFMPDYRDRLAQARQVVQDLTS